MFSKFQKKVNYSVIARFTNLTDFTGVKRIVSIFLMVFFYTLYEEDVIER